MKHTKAIVVTGASGFIGSCVVRELNDRGIDQLILVDHLGESKKWKNLVGKRFLELLHKDEAIDWIQKHASRIGAVIHLGACSSTTEANADYLLSNNTHYSQTLAELAIEHGWRFIYASSAATYGDGLADSISSQLTFDDAIEDLDSLRPLNMYGYSKHLFDLWLRRRGWPESWPDRCVGLKYFNVYGPNEWHKGRMSSHILKMVPQVRQGTIRLFKSDHPEFAHGGQQRDFIYVKDVARMTCDLLDTQHTGLYNIGMGQAHSWNELAHAVMHALNQEAKIEYIDMPSDLIGQYQNYTCAKMDRWNQTGLQPTLFSLTNGVSDYIRNHLLLEQTW